MTIAQRELEPFEQRLTLGEAFRAVGKWVAVLPAYEPAIILKVTGISVLIRYAGNRGQRGQSSHHATVGVEWLIRRADWDDRPKPNWWQQAEASPRPPLELHDLLRPEYSAAALTPDDVLDELLYASYRQQRVLAPGIEPARWRGIFGDDVEAFEARFQDDLANPSCLLNEAVR